ncbi:uncharacterized protein I303_105110 [Kwoniella dejecticola CBS 10117]|uniref:Uncharacterized protein n=1 Tax=Kwoniella dejecticola CBS 10117 TaxID=1296121 RepID=A0A1A6A3F4_9TREE|nr:uncharacterized protein I303_05445 [Kwoniella dejecticola CBS 10117]OBR84586.1 hypothetical protein I303_05445 [Kwoniella dejecticola CBS 10117]
MEDDIPLKRRKSKYDRLDRVVVTQDKVLVWVREIEFFDPDGKATLSPSYGPFMLESHLPLDMLFKQWESGHRKDVPFANWFYAKYPLNHPTPYPVPSTGENEPQQLNREDTPRSLNMLDGTIIFARTLVILPRPIIEPHSPTSQTQNHSHSQHMTLHNHSQRLNHVDGVDGTPSAARPLGLDEKTSNAAAPSSYGRDHDPKRMFMDGE